MRFLLFGLFLAFIACNQEELIVEEDLNGFDTQTKEVTDQIDENVLKYKGEVLKAGQTVDIRNYPNIMEHLKSAGMPIGSNKRGLYDLLTIIITDLCDDSYCSDLGMELKGKKGLSYIQLDNSNQFDPFDDMYYSTEYGTTLDNGNYFCSPIPRSYHRYLLRSFNEDVACQANYWHWTGTYNVTLVDTDGYAFMTNNQSVFFNAYSEAQPTQVNTLDECAIISFPTSPLP